MKKVSLVVEMCTLPTLDGEVSLVISLPGRDGTMIRRWSCRGGVPDDGQVLDIQTVLAGLVVDAFLMNGTGIQAQLFSRER